VKRRRLNPACCKRNKGAVVCGVSCVIYSVTHRFSKISGGRRHRACSSRRLHKVVNDPDTGNQYIELYNGGDIIINCSGMFFMDSEGSAHGTYQVPTSGIHNITSGGTVRIEFGSGTDTSSVWYTGNSGFFDPWADGDLDDTDSILMYPDANATQTKYKYIIDFVAWSSESTVPSTCDDSTDIAVKAGLWEEDSYVNSSGTGIPGIQLKEDGNNEEGVDDWEKIPEFSDVLVPGGAALLSFVVFRGKRRKRIPLSRHTVGGDVLV